MGKLLSLGTKLKYPITISKLLKQPGDEIKKQEAILQYKFTWMQQVGDPFGDEWDEEQTTIADWDSPADGNIKTWKVHEGMVVEKDMAFVDIEESCPHSVQFAGLCGMCGKDMTETNWASSSNDTDRARINMIHDQNFLTVSQGEASKAEEELQRRLLKHRKLSLVVDLDQTIIHACIEPTVGEWQRDPSSPNYEAVKEVKSFQLNDDGPRGLASGCWYYIKMRPGLKEFLAKISEMYELHVYTMGTRAYAVNIAKIVDSDKKLFGDRIISRDENGSMTAKSLARLFPVDTKMVVIIDDRADVWPKNRPNLIKVHPYDFFLGIGDINSSFLPKREELARIAPGTKKHAVDKIEPNVSISTETAETPAGEKPTSSDARPVDGIQAKEIETDDGARVSALEELVRMGGGDDQALRLEQAAEQEKFLEKQLTERPLLHMQEKLDNEDDIVGVPDEKNGDTTSEHHHRHNLLKDDDVELMYLEKHLSQVHKAFYDEYDRAFVSAQGGRVAQLKPGHNKKVSMKEDAADLKIVPDIGQVMPVLKAKVLQGTVIVMSGLVPLNADFMRTEIALQATSFGADLQTKISRRVTHLVTPTSRTRTQKVRQAAKYPHIKVVNQQWLLDSMSKWERQDETPYLVSIPHSLMIRLYNSHNSVELPELALKRASSHSSIEDTVHESDESDDETGDSESENEGDSIRNSQEEERDEEGVMPSDMEGGHSPIDDLKTFDWGSAENELAEFMGSDSENDSDTGSVASHASRNSRSSSRGVKRAHEDATDDDDSDEGSTLVKKQRIANSRTTGLKTVKTPNSAGSESSLPTPGVTGDENDDDGDNTMTNVEDEDKHEDDPLGDLERDLEAELEREAAAEMVAGDGGG